MQIFILKLKRSPLFLIQVALLLLGINSLLADPQISFKNIDADQVSIHFVEADEKLDAKIVKKIFVVRNALSDAVQPDPNTDYLPSTFFKTDDKNSFSGNGNIIAFIGKDRVGEFFLLDLDPKTNYIIDTYYYINKVNKGNSKDKDNKENIENYEITNFRTEFYTLTEKPEKQSYNIMYKDVSDKSMTIEWKRGSGEACIAILRAGMKPNLPFNGRDYKASDLFGKGDKVGNDSYIIYNGKENSVKVRNLDPNNEYFVTILEYNGQNKYINFLKKTGVANPNYKMTKLATPQLLEPKEISDSHFMPAWQKVDGATYYVLDVAEDENFKNILEDYKRVDVGDISDFYVDELEAGKTYFYRLHARNDKNSSEFSIIKEVTLKD